MDFVDYTGAHIDSELDRLKTWHFRLFKKEIKIKKEGLNEKGKPTRIIVKIITCIGIYIGSGTITQTAIENALIAFEKAIQDFKEKKKIKREKKSSRKTKAIKLTKSAFRKALNIKIF